MKLVEQNVNIWKQDNAHEHVARVASVCYQSSEKKDEAADKFYNALLNRKHVSMLRHESCYFFVPVKTDSEAIDTFLNYKVLDNPYVQVENGKYNDQFGTFIATNANYLLDNKELHIDLMKHTVFSAEEMECIHPDMMRYTIIVETARIINDEYTRKSPNCIAGESTRYCNFSKDKFGNEISVTASESYDNEAIKQMLNGDQRRFLKDLCHEFAYTEGSDFDAETSLVFANLVAEWAYIHQTKDLGRTPDDSRNCLPINVNSHFVFTYSIKEWSHILQMRLLGTTGKPHIDAQKIAEYIYNEFKKFGYELIDGELVKR